MSNKVKILAGKPHGWLESAYKSLKKIKQIKTYTQKPKKKGLFGHISSEKLCDKIVISIKVVDDKGKKEGEKE